MSQVLTSATSGTESETARLEQRVAELEDQLAHYDAWIEKAVVVCDKAAHGDLEARLLHVDAKGKLGRMIFGINSLLDYTDAFVREARASLSYAAQGRFFRRVILRGMAGSFKHASVVINNSTDEMKRAADELSLAEQKRLEIADEFETTVKEIASSVSSAAESIHRTSEELNQTAGRTAVEAADAAQSASRTKKSVSKVTDSGELLAESINKVRQQVSTANDVVQRAVGESNQANKIVVSLEEASARIGTVVETIAQIAKQTNLLSLNAAIEAARAGEAGRGFAVVATEVRKLAEQTRSATENAKKEIGCVQDSSGKAAVAITGCGTTITEIHDVSESISKLVGEQAEATAEIREHAIQAAEDTESVSQTIDQTSSTAGETRGSTEALVANANELMKFSATLSESVEHLLKTIRYQS